MTLEEMGDKITELSAAVEKTMTHLEKKSNEDKLKKEGDNNDNDTKKRNGGCNQISRRRGTNPF